MFKSVNYTAELDQLGKFVPPCCSQGSSFMPLTLCHSENTATGRSFPSCLLWPQPPQVSENAKILKMHSISKKEKWLISAVFMPYLWSWETRRVLGTQQLVKQYRGTMPSVPWCCLCLCIPIRVSTSVDLLKSDQGCQAVRELVSRNQSLTSPFMVCYFSPLKPRRQNA